LLAIQNILHLRNEKHIKPKIFNASIYIGLASLAYFWSIGFIILVFLGILFFDPKNYRNWIIPFIGISMIYVFANCFTLLFYDSFFALKTYIDPISFLFQDYLTKEYLFSVGVLSICIICFFSIYLIRFGRKTGNIKPILRLVIIYLVIAIIIAVIAPQKDTSELFFIATPLALIGTTYLEMNYHQLAKEINIWVFILIPFTMLLF
jgi:magnesium-transporting ATPase (P-type)